MAEPQGPQPAEQRPVHPGQRIVITRHSAHKFRNTRIVALVSLLAALLRPLPWIFARKHSHPCDRWPAEVRPGRVARISRLLGWLAASQRRFDRLFLFQLFTRTPLRNLCLRLIKSTV